MSKRSIKLKFIVKSHVKGHYEKRYGKKVYVRPYENNKSKQPVKPVVRLKKIKPITPIKPQEIEEVKEHVRKRYHPVDGHDTDNINFILFFALETAKLIQGFDEGEIVTLSNVIKNCRSIVNRLGYLDENVYKLFTIPNEEPEEISMDKYRLLNYIKKEAKAVNLRVKNSQIRNNIENIIQAISANIP